MILRWSRTPISFVAREIEDAGIGDFGIGENGVEGGIEESDGGASLIDRDLGPEIVGAICGSKGIVVDDEETVGDGHAPSHLDAHEVTEVSVVGVEGEDRVERWGVGPKKFGFDDRLRASDRHLQKSERSREEKSVPWERHWEGWKARDLSPNVSK